MPRPVDLRPSPPAVRGGCWEAGDSIDDEDAEEGTLVNELLFPAATALRFRSGGMYGVSFWGFDDFLLKVVEEKEAVEGFGFEGEV